MDIKCPCGSEELYEECCQPFHEGDAEASNAEELVRSRFSAYAKEETGYIIKTTDPSNLEYNLNVLEWDEEIMAFCLATDFHRLEIHEFIDGEEEAYVTFTATLSQKKIDTSFTEKAHFRKLDGLWVYFDGTVEKKMPV